MISELSVVEYQQRSFSHTAMARDFDLWWHDFEEAGIERVFCAETEEGEVIGFLTVDIDGRAIAIEVMEDYRRQGVAQSMLMEAGVTEPVRDECPEFWDAMRKEFDS